MSFATFKVIKRPISAAICFILRTAYLHKVNQIFYLPIMKSTKLNLFDITMIVVSLVIGMGIFRTPVNVAAQSTSADMFFIAWIIGGIVALCGALTYAEIGSRYPVTGGYYKIFSYCYHPSIAFAINCIILVSNAASLAGVALIGSEYLTNILFDKNADTATIKLSISTAAILVFYGVNLLGLKMSARTQNVLTIIKISLVLILISALFTGTYANTFSSPVIDSTSYGWGHYLKALGACLSCCFIHLWWIPANHQFWRRSEKRIK